MTQKESMTYHQLLRWATNIIARHMQTRFYGSVTFNFQDGKVILSETRYTEKPTLDELE